MIRVLIVDDSAFMRRLLTKILEPYDDIEVVATAMDGVFALDKIEQLEVRPDVITLDLEMPRLDGMSTLKRIVERYQLPVVLVSAHTSKGAKATFDALAAGAVGRPSPVILSNPPDPSCRARRFRAAEHRRCPSLEGSGP